MYIILHFCKCRELNPSTSNVEHLKNDPVKIQLLNEEVIWGDASVCLGLHHLRPSNQFARKWLKESKRIHTDAGDCSNYHTIALIFHTSKILVNIIQQCLHSIIDTELPK